MLSFYQQSTLYEPNAFSGFKLVFLYPDVYEYASIPCVASRRAFQDFLISSHTCTFSKFSSSLSDKVVCTSGFLSSWTLMRLGTVYFWIRLRWKRREVLWYGMDMAKVFVY